MRALLSRTRAEPTGSPRPTADRQVERLERLRWLAAVVVGLAVAAASGIGLWRWQATHQATEPVLVLARTVPALERVAESDLAWREMPRGTRQPDTVQDPRLIVGRAARETLLAGEQVRPERLIDGPGAGLGAGERAVAVPSGLIESVAGTVRPGDVVDVLWVTTKDQPARLVAAGAVVLDLRRKDGGSYARRAQVQQAQQTITQAVAGAVAAPAAPSASTQVPDAVVLKVRARDLPYVGQALAEGRIVLVRSRPGEGDEVWSYFSSEPSQEGGPAPVPGQAPAAPTR